MEHRDSVAQRLRRGLLAEAKVRFAKSQAVVASTMCAADGTPVVLGAPISPSPHALIEEALARIGELAELVAVPSDDGEAAAEAVDRDTAMLPELVDLGCGDGRWILAAARRFSARCVGIDINRELVASAHAALAATPASMQARVELRVGDMFDAPIADTTAAVIVYLYPQTLVRMAQKLENEAPLGCAILSVGFKMVGWDRRRCLVWSTRSSGLKVYLYRNPGPGAAAKPAPAPAPAPASAPAPAAVV